MVLVYGRNCTTDSIIKYGNIEESTIHRQIRENIEGIFWRLFFWRIHGGRENSENIHLAKITHYTVLCTSIILMLLGKGQNIYCTRLGMRGCKCIAAKLSI